MVSYVKKNGFSKQPVEITPENTSKNLNQSISSLNAAKAKKHEA